MSWVVGGPVRTFECLDQCQRETGLLCSSATLELEFSSRPDAPFARGKGEEEPFAWSYRLPIQQLGMLILSSSVLHPAQGKLLLRELSTTSSNCYLFRFG